MNVTVDLRCPITPRRLFGRVRRGDATILPDNVIEVACDDCRRSLAKLGEPKRLVLHQFNILGECIGTLFVDHP